MLTLLNFKAPSTILKRLDNLWFQLSNSACNLKCTHCYLSCAPSSKPHFLGLDKIKNAFEQAKNYDLKEIYLSGGEPFLHPDINNILRMALKQTNVTVLTNGTLVNDKKARFLRQVEQNYDYEIIFRVSLDHYTEAKNDSVRGKGSFKKTLSCIENLIRYDFNPIISAVNLWDEDIDSLKAGFFELMAKFGVDFDNINLKIIPAIKLGEYSKNFQGYKEDELVTNQGLNGIDCSNFDCANTRVITDTGVYSCPMLVNDPRGKVGNTLEDSYKEFFLEPNTCYTCQQQGKSVFNNNWEN